MFKAYRSRAVALVASALVHFGAIVPAFAQPADPRASELSQEAKQRALMLFEAGRTHYNLAEYDQAVANFKAAYELTAAPVLLFNIAQAYRLKGDCPRALEAYRHFLRLAPASPQPSDAEGQLSALAVRCGATAAAAPPAKADPGPARIEVAQAPPPRAQPEQQAARPGRRLSLALLGAGVSLGLGAAGLACGITRASSGGPARTAASRAGPPRPRR